MSGKEIRVSARDLQTSSLSHRDQLATLYDGPADIRYDPRTDEYIVTERDPNMKTYTDLMLDTETYGTEPGCVILEVALVAFDRYSPHRSMKQLVLFPDKMEQIDAGFKIDSATLDFWMEYPEAHDRQRQAQRIPLDEVQEQLNKFYGDHCNGDSLIWAKGSPFDFPMLRSICKEPWGFRNVHDLRTLKLVSKNHQTFVPTMPHSGIDDAVAQAREVQAICSTIDRVG